MKSLKYILTISTILLAPNLYSQESPQEKGLKAITSEVLKAQLSFLSSDWMEGRAAGEKGEYLAGDYIASILQLYGVKPGGDYMRGSEYLNSLVPGGRSYFQNFVLLKSLADEEPELSLITGSGDFLKETSFAHNFDFSVRPVYSSLEITAPVVFAGYAFINEKLKLRAPGEKDIKGRFILKISGYPAYAETKLSPSEINASISAFENYARDMGAAGIIEFSPSALTAGRPEPEEFLNKAPAETDQSRARSRPRYKLPGTSIQEEFIRISISAKAAEAMLNESGIKIDEFLKKANSAPTYDLIPLKGPTIRFRSQATTEEISVRNIIGVVEGNDPGKFIVLGAHYDHMGMKDGLIWNGADDNGSGTVGVMTLARALNATGVKPEKSIIIALWSSEELGLLGSRYFVRNSPFNIENITLNVNFDMISRYISDDNKNSVTMTYTTSLTGLKELTESNLKKYGIGLEVNYQPSDDPPGGSDHRSFVEAGIPVMRFKPGHREEYHTPYDEARTVNWDIMERIIRISFLNVWELANSEW